MSHLRSHSLQIAEATVALRDDVVPKEVAERVCWTLADCLAVMHYGFCSGAARSFIDRMRDKVGAPEATVPVVGLVIAAENAAAINAYLLHSAEIDDSDLRGQLRASAGLLPAVLATAEAADSSGDSLIRALAIGYTLQGRFSSAAGPPIQGRGWMASGVWGLPAAAAASALLLGASAAAISSAIGLAGAAAGGLFQYYYDQSDEKKLIMARSARTAVESAFLARDGEEGASAIIEGKAGLYRMFAGIAAPESDLFTADLARFDGPLFVYPKFFAASHSIIPLLEGLAADLGADFDVAQVKSFVVRGSGGWRDILEHKVNNYAAPENTVGAMLNLSFVLAMAMVKGSVLPDDYAEALADPAIHRLARLGRFEETSGVSELSVEFALVDGSHRLVRARTPHSAEGSKFDPIARLTKIRLLTPMLGVQNQDRLLSCCLGLGKYTSVRQWVADLTQILVPARSNHAGLL